jgi:hypothetical protein
MLDNNISNGCFIFNGINLTQDEKFKLLNDISYRYQIEDHKDVYLVTTNSNVITELPSIIKPQNPYDIPGHFNRNNTVFLTDITFPYFDNPESWESRIVKVLTDYFYTIIGFSSSKQIIKLYENL